MTEIAITTGTDLAAEAALLPRPDPMKVDMASLVPAGAAAMLAAIDNSPAAERAAEVQDDEEVATLDFVGDEPPVVEIPLRYPFRWEGVRHDLITVRQLTTAQVGRISGEWLRRGAPPELMDVYAVMTGLPAKVLRALPHADGDRVVKAGYDFLPPSYRGEAG